MASTQEVCLRCDKVFRGNARNCPECREELRLQKAKAKALLKPKHSKMPKTIIKKCEWCKQEFEAGKWGGVWVSYCDKCKETKPWFRVHFKRTNFV